MEVSRRVIGLLKKVQLCIYGRFFKEHCKAIYLFTRWISKARKRSGWLNVALYLKTSAVCLQRFDGGEFDKHQPLPFPVSLTRSGLPRCIPTFHRRLIAERTDRSENLVRMYLSFFSLYKVILIGKKQSYDYISIVSPPSRSPFDLLEEYSKVVVELSERYIPWMYERPMELMFRWKPSWTASSVRTRGNPFLPKVRQKGMSPFSRMMWDLFSLSLWDKFTIFGSSNPSPAMLRRVWPFQTDNLEWASRYIIPVVSFFASTLTIYPTKGRESFDSENFPFCLYQNTPSIDSLYCKAADDFQYVTLKAYAFCRDRLKSSIAGKDDELMLYFAPGRLAFHFKAEGAGKVRVFAIPNSFKQALLRPAHDWCMSILKGIQMDGTYDQVRPLRRISKLRRLFSFDLSSATDRFPLSVQALTINSIFDPLTAYSWVVCGLGANAFSCQTSSSNRPDTFGLVRFATGQPLGLLSSWPLFALCHHFIVWFCANKVYPGKVFKRYALLGDDIVIAD